MRQRRVIFCKSEPPGCANPGLGLRGPMWVGGLPGLKNETLGHPVFYWSEVGQPPAAQQKRWAKIRRAKEKAAKAALAVPAAK